MSDYTRYGNESCNRSASPNRSECSSDRSPMMSNSYQPSVCRPRCNDFLSDNQYQDSHQSRGGAMGRETCRRVRETVPYDHANMTSCSDRSRRGRDDCERKRRGRFLSVPRDPRALEKSMYRSLGVLKTRSSSADSPRDSQAHAQGYESCGSEYQQPITPQMFPSYREYMRNLGESVPSNLFDSSNTCSDEPNGQPSVSFLEPPSQTDDQTDPRLFQPSNDCSECPRRFDSPNFNIYDLMRPMMDQTDVREGQCGGGPPQDNQDTMYDLPDRLQTSHRRMAPCEMDGNFMQPYGESRPYSPAVPPMGNAAEGAGGCCRQQQMNQSRRCGRPKPPRCPALKQRPPDMDYHSMKELDSYGFCPALCSSMNKSSSKRHEVNFDMGPTSMPCRPPYRAPLCQPEISSELQKEIDLAAEKEAIAMRSLPRETVNALKRIAPGMKMSHITNLVEDSYNPGLIDDTIAGKVNFNEHSFKLYMGPKFREKLRCCSKPNSVPLTLLQAIDVRIEYERWKRNKLLLPKYPNTNLNYAIQCFLRAERVFERSHPLTYTKPDFSLDLVMSENTPNAPCSRDQNTTTLMGVIRPHLPASDSDMSGKTQCC